MPRGQPRVNRSTPPSNDLEIALTNQGFYAIAGVDEVGRGAWAGPLVMAAVILPTDIRIEGLRDSKLLTPRQRTQTAAVIKQEATAWALGVVEAPELDELGLAAALHVAGARAIEGLSQAADIVLFDGKYPLRGVDVAQQTIVHGDQLVQSIAAASVVAKVARDAMMGELHTLYPQLQPYRFDRNKGYPSLHHRTVLADVGPSLQHRRCFAPIATLTVDK